MTVTTVIPEVSRDHYGRPLIKPQGGGKPVAYTRCTTFVGAFEDTHNLTQWKMRQAAVGLSLRPDLQLAVAAHKDDKSKLNKILQEALDAAASSAGATTGIALHALTEQRDRGQELVGIPLEAAADLAAYAEATADFKAVFIEQMTVHDPYKVAGTPDRIVSYRGKRYIADLKTGDVQWGAGRIAAQLAMYARSKTYDVATGERSMHGAELDKGLVIHLPAGSGTCEVLWVDLLAGWDIVNTCQHVRRVRGLKARDLCEPFTTVEVALAASLSLADRIRACDTADAIRGLWAENASDWTDELTQIAKDRIASLGPKEGAVA